MRAVLRKSIWCICVVFLTLSVQESYALSALHLTASTPTNNSDNAARVDTVAVLTFSAPLNATTVLSNHVVLRHGTTVDPVTLTVSGNQIFVKVESELLPATPYTLSVVGVQGSGGELLTSPISIAFRTRDGTWQTAQQIDTYGHVFFNSNRLAINKQGDAFAMWIQFSSAGHYDLIASRYSNGQWSPQQRINIDLQGDVESADIAIGQDGKAIAVWEETPYNSNYAPSRIWASIFTPTNGWGVPQLVDAAMSQDSLSPRVAISSDGSAIAVWSQSTQGTHRIFFSRYTTAGGWESASAIDAISHEPGSTSPRIAFDTKGNAFAIWQQMWHGTSLIWGNFYLANHGWIAPHIVQSNWNSPGTRPDIAFDGHGTAFAVWDQWDGVYAGRFTQAQGWSPSVALALGTDLGTPLLAVNTKGDAIVVWYQFDQRFNPTQPVNSVWGTRFTNSNSWETPALLQYPSRLDGFPNSVAIDEAGNAIAVWTQYNGSFWRIYAGRYQVGYGWVGRKVIDTYNNNSSSNARVAIDANGNALAIWEQTLYGTANDLIWANQFK